MYSYLQNLIGGEPAVSAAATARATMLMEEQLKNEDIRHTYKVSKHLGITYCLTQPGEKSFSLNEADHKIFMKINKLNDKYYEKSELNHD